MLQRRRADRQGQGDNEHVRERICGCVTERAQVATPAFGEDEWMHLKHLFWDEPLVGDYLDPDSVEGRDCKVTVHDAEGSDHEDKYRSGHAVKTQPAEAASR